MKLQADKLSDNKDIQDAMSRAYQEELEVDDDETFQTEPWMPSYTVQYSTDDDDDDDDYDDDDDDDIAVA